MKLVVCPEFFCRFNMVTIAPWRRIPLLGSITRALPISAAPLLLLLSVIGGSTTVAAATLCDEAPSSFRIDSLLVREPGEEEFVEADADSFCYQLRDYPTPDIPETKSYEVTLNNAASNDVAAYPAGTEFRFTLVNLDTSFKLGGIVTSSPTLLASYADQTGGSEHEVSLQVELEQGQTSVNVMIALANPSGGGWFSTLERVTISKSSMNPNGFPDLFFSSETGRFEMRYTFQGYPTDGPFDSYIDVFFPLATINRGKLSNSVLAALTDPMLMTMFSTEGGEGMRVNSLMVRKSFGERGNLNGTPTSTSATGLVVRMELVNDGWAPGLYGAGIAPRIQAASSAGGFRLTKTARSALRACTIKKKLKKGYRFVKLNRGRGIACQKIPRKRR